MEITDEGMCFACGKNNPIGLKLKYHTENNTGIAEFTPDVVHQGFMGITHGGLVATLLDEVMAKLLCDLQKPAVTVEIKLSLRQPARIGEKLLLKSEIEEERSRGIKCRAEARREDGTLVAQSHALFMRMKN